MIKIKTLIVSWFFFLLFSGPETGVSQEFPEKPNFIIFYVDNLGYGDIGPFGSVINRTPKLDQLAKEGTRFTHEKIFANRGQDLQLFNVDSDPGETINVISSHSQLISEMMALAQKAKEDLGDGNGVENHVGQGQRPVGRVDHPVPLL